MFRLGVLYSTSINTSVGKTLLVWAKFQEIIPRNPCFGAFLPWNLASEFYRKTESPAELKLGQS